MQPESKKHVLQQCQEALAKKQKSNNNKIQMFSKINMHDVFWLENISSGTDTQLGK
jgi:hypothetical protein